MSQLSFRLLSLSVVFTVVGSCGRDSENPMVRTFSIRPAGPCEEVHSIVGIALSNHYSNDFSDFEYLYPRAIQAILTAFERTQPDLSNLSIWYQSKKAIIAQAMESPDKDIQQCSSIEKIAELVDRIESERQLGNLRISPTPVWNRFHENRSDAQVYRIFLTAFAKVLDPYSSYARSISYDSYGFGIRTDAEFALSLGLTGKEVKSLNVLGLRRPGWSLGQNLRSEQSTTSGVGLKLRDEIIALKPGIEEWKYLPGQITRDQKDPTWISVEEFFDHGAVGDLIELFNSNDDPELHIRIKRDEEVIDIRLEGTLNSSVVDHEPLVSAEILNNEFFYLRLFEFGDGASLQLAQALEEIKLQWMQQNTPEKQPKIILDLRFNPGGSIIEAQRIAQFFMTTGPMFQSHTREGEDFSLQTISTLSTHTPTLYPMVVLINHLSASASELLTQALQESNRAWIVGQRSFGKGIGQTAIELGAASSLGGRFWLTHLVFYGLSGQTVQPKGLEPDLAIIDEKVERFRNECESKKRQCRSQSMSASLKQIPERERISPQTISAHPEYKGQRSLQTIHALKDSLSAEVKNELDPQLAAAQRLLQQAPSLISPE